MVLLETRCTTLAAHRQYAARPIPRAWCARSQRPALCRGRGTERQRFLGWQGRDVASCGRQPESSNSGCQESSANRIAGYLPLDAARFAPTAASHHTLSLRIMEIDLLDADYALLIGRYRLKEGRKLQKEGQTTLLFHRSAPGRPIINDHSC